MRPLVALALGTAAYLLTQEVVVGVLVGAVSLWLLQGTRGRRTESTVSSQPLETPRYRPRPGSRDDEGIAVVCKQVTAERQEWASVRTGRLYDVLSPDGLKNARPGDQAQLVVSGTRYLIKLPRARR